MERTYQINDVVGSNFLRLPLCLLANPKYKQMSLEAKFIYALLLNRMTLSQRNGWINENGEVYLIYTRQEAAETLNITYKKTIAAFKELIQNGLLHEQRQGLGLPNLLYVLKAELSNEDAAEFGAEFDGEKPPEESETDENQQICQNGTSRHAKTAHQDMPNQHIKNCQNSTSRPADSDTSGTAETGHQDIPNTHTNKTYSSYTDLSEIDLSEIESKSINPTLPLNGNASTGLTDGQANEELILQYFLSKCELQIFTPDVAKMLQQARRSASSLSGTIFLHADMRLRSMGIFTGDRIRFAPLKESVIRWIAALHLKRHSV